MQTLQRMFLVALLLLSTSCCKRSVVKVETSPRLETPPPTLETPIKAFEYEGYACYEEPEHIRLWQLLERMFRWELDAWELCGAVPKDKRE